MKTFFKLLLMKGSIPALSWLLCRMGYHAHAEQEVLDSHGRITTVRCKTCEDIRVIDTFRGEIVETYRKKESP